jgi:hypothetical protein
MAPESPHAAIVEHVLNVHGGAVVSWRANGLGSVGECVGVAVGAWLGAGVGLAVGILTHVP